MKTRPPPWLIAIVLPAFLVAGGCGGESSGGDAGTPPPMATEPAPEGTSINECLTKAGFAFQRQGPTEWSATRNGRTFISIRKFKSASEAAAADEKLPDPLHVRVGTRVAYGGTRDDLETVRGCLPP